MFRWSVDHKEIRKALENVIGIEPSVHDDVEALSAKFVYDRQDLEGTAIVSTVLHKIIRPDMVAMSRSEPDTRPIIEPQTSPLGLLLRNFQPLLTPDAFHPLMIDLPTGSPEQCCDTAIPIAPIPFGKRNDVVSQSLLGTYPRGYEPLG
jgi:hypothetical protein